MELVVNQQNVKEVVEDLSRLIVALEPKDQEFAKSLVSYYSAKGYVSDKQMYWIGRMVVRAIGGRAQTDEPTPAVAVKIPGPVKLIALFDTAGTKLKYPKLTFGTVNLRLSKAGSLSKTPGAINFVAAEKNSLEGYSGWMGKMLTDGTLQWHKDISSERRQSITRFLMKLVNDPQETIKVYGTKTGHCCFCNSGLTDQKSLTAGYGPVCAKQWGMPWGAK